MGLIIEKRRRGYSGLDADKASIPAGGKEVNDTFLATDTKILYFWDGAAWIIIPLDVIVAGMIKTDAVETAKIKDLNVTVGKLAGGITKAKVSFGLSVTDYRKVGQYHTGFGTSVVTAWGCNVDRIHGFAFYVPNTVSFDRIAIHVATLGAGLNRLGIYEDDGNIYPGDLRLDAGTVDVSANGLKEIVIDETLTPGLYWLAGLANVSHQVTAHSPYGQYTPCGSVDIVTPPHGAWSKAHAYGVLPDPFPGGATGAGFNMFVNLRKA